MFDLKIPQSIFVHADGFFRAGTPRSDPPNPYDMFALVTNSAIASELYLKCLIHIEKGQLVKNQHNLRRLFCMLERKTQDIISERFDAILAKAPKYDLSAASLDAQKVAMGMPASLREALKKGADAFVEWRYIYEDEIGQSVDAFSLFPLPQIVRGVILGRKPEWAKFVFTMTRIGPALPLSGAP